METVFLCSNVNLWKKAAKNMVLLSKSNSLFLFPLIIFSLHYSDVFVCVCACKIILIYIWTKFIRDAKTTDCDVWCALLLCIRWWCFAKTPEKEDKKKHSNFRLLTLLAFTWYLHVMFIFITTTIYIHFYL